MAVPSMDGPARVCSRSSLLTPVGEDRGWGEDVIFCAWRVFVGVPSLLTHSHGTGEFGIGHRHLLSHEPLRLQIQRSLLTRVVFNSKPLHKGEKDYKLSTQGFKSQSSSLIFLFPATNHGNFGPEPSLKKRRH